MQTVGFSLAYFGVQLVVITHSNSATKKKTTTTNNCFPSTGPNDLRLKFPNSAPAQTVFTRLLRRSCDTRTRYLAKQAGNF